MKFFVQSPHTEAECRQALEEMRDVSLLDKSWFACDAGDHTGYLFLDGDSESKVRQMLPKAVRDGATLVPVRKYTKEQLAEKHVEQPST
jgi:hypothetical protein